MTNDKIPLSCSVNRFDWINRMVGRMRDDPRFFGYDADMIEKLEHSYNLERESILSIESNPEWPENNLEYDLRTSKSLCWKVRENECYAGALYQVLCQYEFVKKNNVIDIIKNVHLTYSARHAAKIVTNMRGTGEYTDFYPAIRQPQIHVAMANLHSYTEAREDIENLGWHVVEDSTVKDDF